MKYICAVLLLALAVHQANACFSASGPRAPPKQAASGGGEPEYVDYGEDYGDEYGSYEEEYEEPEYEETSYEYESQESEESMSEESYSHSSESESKSKSDEREFFRGDSEDPSNFPDYGGNSQPASNWPDGGNWQPAPVQSKPLPGPLGSGRNAQQAAAESGSALDVVLAALTAGDISQIPIETLNSIPPSTLAKLPPDVLGTLPPEILAKLSVDSHIKATALGETIRYLPVDKVVGLPWKTVIKGLPAEAINSFSPTVLGAIPWPDVLSDVPPDVMGGLALSTLQVVPPSAWQGISFEALQAIKPNILASLPLSSLKNIPPGHLKKLGPDILSAFSKDVLAAISPDLLNQAVQQGTQFRGDTLASAQGLAAGTIGGLGRRRLALARKL